MVSKIFSCAFHGLNCETIEVQADVSNGLPSFRIVGLGDASVQEAKERVRASIKNSGAKFPQIKKTINLAPAEIRKQGTHFDLPIAVSLLLASDQIPNKFEESLVVGELSLTGKLKPVKGILAIAHHAKLNGFKRIFLPKANLPEASFIEDIELYPLDSLRELIEFTFGNISLVHKKKIEFPAENKVNFDALNSIIGHEKIKRALIIAAAGGHNTLLYGSPGCGKTLLCRTFQNLLPPMTKKEILETTKIFSIAGLLSENSLVTSRPFREVHNTATLTAMIGGGIPIKPGEISLAHNGVLFLDEIAEFPKNIIESLRQPLEDGYIHLHKGKNIFKMPSSFTLLATMNPCPCGYKNDLKIRCICDEYQIQNYQKKLSGPLRDRFDIFLEVSRISMQKSFKTKNIDFHEQERAFLNALEIQQDRFEHYHFKRNSQMNLEELKLFCPINDRGQNMLNKASEILKLSNRGYLKTIKLARTIADLSGEKIINDIHIGEALQYRSGLLYKNS